MDREPSGWLWRIARWIAIVVYAVVVVYNLILTAAFVLRLLGADPDRDLVDWVYRSADRIMEPFRGIFPVSPPSDQSVFDAALLFGAIVYAILGLAVGVLVDWLGRRGERRRTGDAGTTSGAGGAIPAPPPPGPPGSGAGGVAPGA